MKRIFAVCLLLSITALIRAQNPMVVFSLEEALKANPDSVINLSLEKSKLTTLPQEIYRFKNLEFLDLSRNKLVSISDSIKLFTKLQKLDLSRNDLEYFPLPLCAMPHVKALSLARNNIGEIPDCIKYMNSLEKLDIWDNPLRSLPESLTELKQLKYLDLRGILFSVTFQKKWDSSLPSTKIYFDPPCNCMD